MAKGAGGTRNVKNKSMSETISGVKGSFVLEMKLPTDFSNQVENFKQLIQLHHG